MSCLNEVIADLKRSETSSKTTAEKPRYYETPEFKAKEALLNKTAVEWYALDEITDNAAKTALKEKMFTLVCEMYLTNKTWSKSFQYSEDVLDSRFTSYYELVINTFFMLVGEEEFEEEGKQKQERRKKREKENLFNPNAGLFSHFFSSKLRRRRSQQWNNAAAGSVEGVDYITTAVKNPETNREHDLRIPLQSFDADPDKEYGDEKRRGWKEKVEAPRDRYFEEEYELESVAKEYDLFHHAMAIALQIQDSPVSKSVSARRKQMCRVFFTAEVLMILQKTPEDRDLDYYIEHERDILRALDFGFVDFLLEDYEPTIQGMASGRLRLFGEVVPGQPMEPIPWRQNRKRNNGGYFDLKVYTSYFEKTEGKPMTTANITQQMEFYKSFRERE